MDNHHSLFLVDRLLLFLFRGGHDHALEELRCIPYAKLLSLYCRVVVARVSLVLERSLLDGVVSASITAGADWNGVQALQFDVFGHVGSKPCHDCC